MLPSYASLVPQPWTAACLYGVLFCPLQSQRLLKRKVMGEPETVEEEDDGRAKWLEPPKSVKELPRAKLL